MTILSRENFENRDVVFRQAVQKKQKEKASACVKQDKSCSEKKHHLDIKDNFYLTLKI